MIKSKIEIPISRRWATFACLLGSLLVHSTAHAIPVGTFNWNEPAPEECGVFCGALFSVENFSTEPFSLGLLGDSFLGVVVGLQTDTGPMSLLLGDIAPGESSQSVEDLFGVAIASAGLTLGFGVPSLPGLIQLLDQDGNIVTALTGPGSLSIDYAVDIVSPTPVTEPPVLLLMTGGLLAVALARKTKRRNREPA